MSAKAAFSAGISRVFPHPRLSRPAACSPRSVLAQPGIASRSGVQACEALPSWLCCENPRAAPSWESVTQQVISRNGVMRLDGFVAQALEVCEISEPNPKTGR